MPVRAALVKRVQALSLSHPSETDCPHSRSSECSSADNSLSVSSALQVARCSGSRNL